MRIGLCHVSVKGSVREMLQTRTVVSSRILGSWDVGGSMVVAVLALVVAGHLAKVGRRSGCGHRAAVDAGDSGGVVAQVFESGVTDGLVPGHDVELCQHGCLLKVTVGDRAMGVCGRDEGVLDVRGEWFSPVVALAGGVVEDAAHAGLGGVRGS